MKAPSSELLQWGCILIAAAAYIGATTPAPPHPMHLVGIVLAVSLGGVGLLLLVRFRWSPELFALLFLAMLGKEVYVGVIEGFDRTQVIRCLAVGAAFFGYLSLRREVRGSPEEGLPEGIETDVPPDDSAEYEWHKSKSAMMEKRLGVEHDMVMHAIIPYAIGGGLDLYYYPHGIPGTAVATKELSEQRGEGSTNDAFQCYELVMFTRHSLDLDKAKGESTPFGQAHRNINVILNHIARYSAHAQLSPNETCEFPAEMPGVGGKCLIFDAYPYRPEMQNEFGLMAIIEVFRSEMDFARANGGAQLLGRLKERGHYPYSDLDRDAVA